MAEPTPQRVYRAVCPNCGADVSLRSAASALAVCSYCRSTLVRDGGALRRIGQSAELFDDHSPLQLGSAGRWQGASFTLVGRLQLRSAGGNWNEWHALFDAGGDASTKSGWLSEDNGGYAFSFDAPPPERLPPAQALRVGEGRVLGGQEWSVASLVTATLSAAEGELPFLPATDRPFVVAELRNVRGEVASIDYGAETGIGSRTETEVRADDAAPRWSIGRGVELAALAMSGLREGSERVVAGRSLACPNCGAALEVQLASTRSIVCHQCRSVIDLGAGGPAAVGADLAAHALNHYGQDTPGAAAATEPLIPLGRSGTLALGSGGPQAWQVVGYVERCSVVDEGDEDDEQTFWREYLLYHRGAGFAFLVDSEEGWGWVRAISGAPQVQGDTARWQGHVYRELYRYRGQITYVLGEFYWPLERGQRTENIDYEGPGGRQLNREQTGSGADAEVTWSAGAALDAATLFKAFHLADTTPRAALQRERSRDVTPLAGRSSGSLAGIFLFMLFAVLVFSLVRCSRDDCASVRRTFGEASNEYRQCAQGSGGRSAGGSFGGFSTGGGHK